MWSRPFLRLFSSSSHLISSRAHYLHLPVRVDSSVEQYLAGGNLIQIASNTGSVFERRFILENLHQEKVVFVLHQQIRRRHLPPLYWGVDEESGPAPSKFPENSAGGASPPVAVGVSSSPSSRISSSSVGSSAPCGSVASGAVPPAES